MVYPRMGRNCHFRFGIKGHAQPGLTQHGKVIGAIAHRHCFMRLKHEFCPQFDQRGEFRLLAQYWLGNRSGKQAVFNFQQVGPIIGPMVPVNSVNPPDTSAV